MYMICDFGKWEQKVPKMNCAAYLIPAGKFWSARYGNSTWVNLGLTTSITSRFPLYSMLNEGTISLELL